jgi:hypothetical protein
MAQERSDPQGESLGCGRLGRRIKKGITLLMRTQWTSEILLARRVLLTFPFMVEE